MKEFLFTLALVLALPVFAAEGDTEEVAAAVTACDCATDIAACRAQGNSCAEYCEGKDLPECNNAANDDYTKAEAETTEEDLDIFES